MSPTGAPQPDGNGQASPLHVTTSEADGIITVTFDRQEKRNAISDEMIGALWDAAHALAEGEDLRVMIITAVGPYFTAGMCADTDRTTHRHLERLGRRWSMEATR